MKPCNAIIAPSFKLFKPSGKRFIFCLDGLRLYFSYVWRSNAAGYLQCTSAEHFNKVFHRLLLCAPKGRDVDHINRDTRDNRLVNLRLVNRAQNIVNSLGWSRRTGKYKGVRRKGNRFDARFAGKHLGSFKTEEAAAAAYNDALTQAYPEHGCVNELPKNNLPKPKTCGGNA